MDDTRELLRRGVGDFAPLPDAYGRVLDRRDRKARNRRAGAVGAVALLALLAGVFVLRQLDTPPSVLDDGQGRDVLTSSGAIVFAATDLVEGPPDGRGLNDPRSLYVVRPGGAPQRIADGSQDGLDRGCPAFSPDGTTLAYVVGPRRGAGTAIDGLAFGPDGRPAGEPFEIVADAEIAGCPSWSAAGDTVAVDDGGSVRIAGLDGSSRVVPQADGRSVIAFAWSPRDETLAVLDSAGLRLVSADGDSTTVWTREGRRLPNAVVWSEDGKRLAVSGSVGPWDTCCEGHTPFIDVVTVADGGVDELPVRGDRAGDVARVLTWMPRSDWQLLVALNDRVGFVSSGSDAVEPIDLSYGVASGPVVSPDQTWILYVAYDGESYALVTEPLGAGGPIELTPWTFGLYTNVDDLAWQPIPREG